MGVQGRVIRMDGTAEGYRGSAPKPCFGRSIVKECQRGRELTPKVMLMENGSISVSLDSRRVVADIKGEILEVSSGIGKA